MNWQPKEDAMAELEFSEDPLKLLMQEMGDIEDN